MTTLEESKREPSYEELVAENALLRQRITELEARLKALEDRLAQDSQNSSNPPSSDSFGRRTKSQRTKSGKAPGGQKGHKGKTLKMVSDPDEVVLHLVEACSECGAGLSESVLVELDKRQVFDLPPLKLLVSEHQAETRRCLDCGSLNRADFPEEAGHKVQYGPRLKGLGSV